MTETNNDAAPAAAPDMMAFLNDLSTKMDRVLKENADLKAELAEQKASTPRMRPMVRDEQKHVNNRRAQVFEHLSKAGDKAQGSLGQVPVDYLGHRIPDNMLQFMQPAFLVGEEVRINPDVAREGWADGVIWADILKKQRCEGYGTVTRVSYLSKAGYWKYRVRVPGLTNDRGDGFAAYELLRAD